MSLIQYLKLFLNRPGFDNFCSQWKSNSNRDSIYKDNIMFDGQVWKDFKVYNGVPFLSEPFTYGLMLNVDLFKLCKHTKYSLGAIYVTIMNLPRMLRFRHENFILIGLIPGPKEPI